MIKMTLIWIVVFASLYLSQLVNGFSVCDPVDAIFIVDADSLRYNNDEISDFIESIIVYGSNENIGVSIYVYGDDINPINELKLIETFDAFRENKTEITLNYLNKELKSVISTSSSSSTVSISLKQAFISASEQTQPVRYD